MPRFITHKAGRIPCRGWPVRVLCVLALIAASLQAMAQPVSERVLDAGWEFRQLADGTPSAGPAQARQWHRATQATAMLAAWMRRCQCDRVSQWGLMPSHSL